MNLDISLVRGPIDRVPGVDSAACAVFADERPLRDSAGWIDWRLNGSLSRLLAAGRFTGAFCENLLTTTQGRLPFRRLFLFGLGRSPAYDSRACAQAIQHVAFTLVAAGADDVVVDPVDLTRGRIPLSTGISLLVDGLSTGAARLQDPERRMRLSLLADAAREEELRRILMRPVARPAHPVHIEVVR